jgi:Cu2+-containing amine oxidase
MDKVLRKRFMVLGSMVALLTGFVFGVQLLAAQGQNEVPRIEEHGNPERKPLTSTEIQQALSVLRRDSRIRETLARSQQVQTILVERHQEDKEASPSERRAHVVLYIYDTNETISSVVTLEPRPSVEDLTVTRGQPPGLTAQEVEEAKQLALDDPTVQERLRDAGLAGRESELIITHLLAHASSPDDPCSIDRCVALFFNTEDAVLAIEPIVNLITGEVQIQ